MKIKSIGKIFVKRVRESEVSLYFHTIPLEKKWIYEPPVFRHLVNFFGRGRVVMSSEALGADCQLLTVMSQVKPVLLSRETFVQFE